ncbi:S46 family peptidase [Bacteroides sp. 214]|uniref:S46 family peptidase n=1 Tax=Bacteroides sp. 214 TaxID=2302935 RepID=UPI0013D01443|nr:S46 family peptidase [Bacteroides sp. 214]NDW12105.1 S46 family peptidase [Bacteroides sp. 214]
MKKQTIFFLLLLLITTSIHADEGMWMLTNLNKQTRKAMKELGLQMNIDKLYNPQKPSLSDAVVNFGGFCSGVVVSSDGLVFTNHHCGFNAIQQHSSVERDILKDGYVAENYTQELPCEELYVRFLLRTEDVTQRILREVSLLESEEMRQTLTDSLIYVIQNEVYEQDSTVVAIVDAFYGGNEFWLSVYQDYDDVRLVFAPPTSIGKFGWDTDNWMWPRHTGDFSVFRIYADKNNNPARYSADNVPYHPPYVAPVSLDGYAEGSFCMTLGYPGSTERYLSSFGIEEMMLSQNQAMIDVRGVKQEIWKRWMNKDNEIAIKYAAKYDESSNYWKNSIGTNNAIRELGILEKKRGMEATLQRWIRQTPTEREQLLHLLTDLDLAYKKRRSAARAISYLSEAFMNGPELTQLAAIILNFDYEAEETALVSNFKKILKQYENMDANIDKEVFAAMLKTYREHVEPEFLPDFYNTIATVYNGNDQAFVDSLYASSKLTTPLGLQLIVNDSTFNLIEDFAVSVALDVLMKGYEINNSSMEATEQIVRGERLFNAAVRRMYAHRNFYPDANFTMRLSFGTIRGYNPYDGATYNYYTTTKGIFEKVKQHQGDTDFYVQPDILKAFSDGEFGKYANDEKGMNVCFISDNDITGGNSGSAMFNAKGELMGLAFDGNWEAMSGDILYDPNLQRCIGVDVRYMLYLIENFGGRHLIEELTIR